MSDTPQQSLRRHRQTLLPPQNGLQQLATKSKNSNYDVLLGPNSSELPSVQQKDKEKVCFKNIFFACLNTYTYICFC